MRNWAQYIFSLSFSTTILHIRAQLKEEEEDLISGGAIKFDEAAMWVYTVCFFGFPQFRFVILKQKATDVKF